MTAPAACGVLVLNAGSSSLKFSVFGRGDDRAWPLLARGGITGIGTAAELAVTDGSGAVLDERRLDASVADADGALDVVAQWLRARFAGLRLEGVGHRVVHGGPRFAAPVRVTPEVLAALRALEPLAPLHQPYNLRAIDAVAARMPDVPQVACFDTAFHRGMSEVARLVPLPGEVCGTDVQRYGFHGLSYEYVAGALNEVAPEIASGRVIVAHLGSGASLCALRSGRSIDTTLGFTALDGLCMGTRPGALDPGVVLYLFQNLGMTADAVEEVLYRRSGLLGISGASNDMRDLLARDDARARLAVDYFVYRAAREIGALTAVQGGLDALVFTAGIGENSPEIRTRISTACAWLGVELDASANAAGRGRISAQASRVAVWVVPTNEELMIAQHLVDVLGIDSTSTHARPAVQQEDNV